MELKFKDILGKYKGVPGIVALHGPSLTPHIDKIQTLQQEQGFKRNSVNQWYDYFVTKPDAWIVSNTEYTIYNSIAPNFFWDEYNKGWPKNVFNKYNIPLFFNDTADLTSYDFIKNNLKCDNSSQSGAPSLETLLSARWRCGQCSVRLCLIKPVYLV